MAITTKAGVMQSLHNPIRYLCTCLFFVLASVSGLASAAKTADEFGRQFAAAVNEHNVSYMAQAFDQQAFAAEAAEAVFDDASDRRAFALGVQAKNTEEFMSEVFSAVYLGGGETKYLRALDGEKPLIRIDYRDGGTEYFWLVTRRDNGGELAVIDMFFMSSGRALSEAVAAMAQLLVAPSNHVLAKLFGIKQVDQDILERVSTVVTHKQQGNYIAAYKALDELPDKVRQHRMFMDIAVQLAGEINDEVYRQELDRLARHHGEDPSTSFVLIDHYLYMEQYDKGQKALDRVIGLLGEDGALYTLKANFSLLDEDFSATEAYARRAIELEADMLDAYWALVTVLNHDERYTELVKLFQDMETTFEFQFTAEDFADEFYRGFASSAAFKNWL